ncbi:MAG: 2-oxo acid dehydrogenase subunit E2 [Ignavibacteria bacterium]|nr:2-oxo acid dehydrogenase subunit E2 [Ignavibacteria bacterium]
MLKEIVLPEVSDNVESGDVVKVLVKAGDAVKADQSLIELETDKAAFEVPSTDSGVITEVCVKQGEKIKIGQVIVKLETDADTEAKTESVQKASPVETVTQEITDPKPEPLDTPEESKPARTEAPMISEHQELPGSNAPASPSVRRLARELGAEITRVKGTGTAGRITEEDVKRHVKEVMTGVSAMPSAGIVQKALPDFRKWGDVRIEPMNKVRMLTAESMSYAWSTVPMVTQFDEADITALEEFRKKYGSEVEKEGGRLTVTSILTAVVALALREFPQFNTSIDLARREIIYKEYCNIGIAVDTDRGLLVPVVKNADKKSITELSVEISVLAEKCRNKKIMPEEMDGGNFTISNLGGIGGTAFTPIVYSPQVAIIGVSRSSRKPVYNGDNFVPKLILPLSLTYDHRIIDGADAARFLRWVCDALENPLRIFL